VWAKGLWNRLNGSPGQPFTKDGPFGLPLPVGTEDQRKQALQQLNVQLDALEKQLQVGREVYALKCGCWDEMQGGAIAGLATCITS